MKNILYFIVLIGVTFSSKSQSLIIDATVYKKGIYRTFEEFKYNTPSIEFKYKTITKERGYGFMNTGGQVTYYLIDIDRKLGKTIGKVFGFCDGKNIYINQYLQKLSPKRYFIKIDYLGKYCYYEDISCTTTPNGGSGCSLSKRIMDINTGEIIHLTKYTLRKLIAKNTELLKAFNEEPKKSKKIKQYTIQHIKTL